MQLKREAKLLTVIGLNTKHADCRIIDSSKKRTSAQEAESRTVIENLIKDNTGIHTVLHVAVTDGSFRGNPGPCVSFFPIMIQQN